MGSIKNKIQSAFVGVILLLGTFAIVVVVINQMNVLQNQTIIQTMTMEYNIIAMTDNLIKTYNNVVKNPGNITFQKNYESIKVNLIDNISRLKTRIISQESKMLLLGVENTVHQVISETDSGLQEIKDNNFQNFSDHFAEAHKKNEFVQNDTSILLQKELEYLSKTGEKAKQLYVISLVISALVFIGLIILMIVYSHSFSRQIITPIEKLTRSVEKVSQGDMNETIDSALTEQNDEVGVLSRAYVSMVENIKDMISKLNESNAEISAAKNALETNNVELKKLNQYMVDRELKMIELKKKISELTMLLGKSNT